MNGRNGAPGDETLTRAQARLAVRVRGDRTRNFVLVDLLSPLLIAVIWLLLPLGLGTGARIGGAVGLAMLAPLDLAFRRALPDRWANYALLIVLRLVPVLLVTALLPSVFHAGVIAMACVCTAALHVESQRRIVALAVATTIGFIIIGAGHDVAHWPASVAMLITGMVGTTLWAASVRAEQSQIDRRHDELLARTPMFSWEIDVATGIIVSIVGNSESVIGWHPDELVGHHIQNYVTSEAIADAMDDFEQRPDGSRISVVEMRHRDGHPVVIRETRRMSSDGLASGVSVDITELARTSDALRWQAEHDSLTSLANRKLFEQTVTERLERKDRPVALLVADLDRFKEVNDTLGHPTGDRLLRVLSERFVHSLTGVAQVARIGGDEFGFLIDTEATVDQALAVGDEIGALAAAPVEVDGIQIAVGCSVGAALSPTHGTSYGELLKHADIAAYQAKRTGGGVRVFHSAPDELSVQRLRLLSEISGAVRRGEFELNFQPQVELATGQIIGAEGLARWNHPELGQLLPKDFIDAIEVAAAYQLFTNEVLRQAVAFAAATEAAGHPLQVSVNLASASFLDRRLPSVVAELLAEHQVDGRQLTLEVTETDLIDEELGSAVFDELAALGCKLSIDDFGTGYSTLVRLRALDVDEVKIDRSFVSGLGQSAEDSIIVRTIVDLALLLGQTVVAEGVETPEQLELLRRIGCPAAQGWLFAKALPAGELLEMVASGQRFESGTDVQAPEPGHWADASRLGLDVRITEPLIHCATEGAAVGAIDRLFDQLDTSGPAPVAVVRDLTGRLIRGNHAFRALFSDEIYQSLIGTRDDDHAVGHEAGRFEGPGFAMSGFTYTDGEAHGTVTIPGRHPVEVTATVLPLDDVDGRYIGSVQLSVSRTAT